MNTEQKITGALFFAAGLVVGFCGIAAFVVIFATFLVFELTKFGLNKYKKETISVSDFLGNAAVFALLVSCVAISYLSLSNDDSPVDQTR